MLRCGWPLTHLAVCAALRRKHNEASLSGLLRSGAGAGAVDQQLALEVQGGATCLTRPVCAHVNGAPIPDALARLQPGASYGSKLRHRGSINGRNHLNQ